MTHELTKKMGFQSANENQAADEIISDWIDEKINAFYPIHKSGTFDEKVTLTCRQILKNHLGFESPTTLNDCRSGIHSPDCAHNCDNPLKHGMLCSCIANKKEAQVEQCQHINYLQNIFGPVGIPSKIKHFDCPWCGTPHPIEKKALSRILQEKDRTRKGRRE